MSSKSRSHKCKGELGKATPEAHQNDRAENLNEEMGGENRKKCPSDPSSPWPRTSQSAQNMAGRTGGTGRAAWAPSILGVSGVESTQRFSCCCSG